MSKDDKKGGGRKKGLLGGKRTRPDGSPAQMDDSLDDTVVDRPVVAQTEGPLDAPEPVALAGAVTPGQDAVPTVIEGRPGTPGAELLAQFDAAQEAINAAAATPPGAGGPLDAPEPRGATPAPAQAREVATRTPRPAEEPKGGRRRSLLGGKSHGGEPAKTHPPEPPPLAEIAAPLPDSLDTALGGGRLTPPPAPLRRGPEAPPLPTALENHFTPAPAQPRASHGDQEPLLGNETPGGPPERDMAAFFEGSSAAGITEDDLTPRGPGAGRLVLIAVAAASVTLVFSALVLAIGYSAWLATTGAPAPAPAPVAVPAPVPVPVPVDLTEAPVGTEAAEGTDGGTEAVDGTDGTEAPAPAPVVAPVAPKPAAPKPAAPASAAPQPAAPAPAPKPVTPKPATDNPWGAAPAPVPAPAEPEPKGKKGRKSKAPK